MDYRLIALDLDGTLLTSKQVISPRTRAALADARARGITAVIATGRTPHSALVYSREISAAHVICCNGGAILEGSGEYITTKPLPAAPLEHLLRLVPEHERDGKLLVECYTQRGILLDRPLQQVRAFLEWVRPHAPGPMAFAKLLRAWRLNRIRPVRSLAGQAAKGLLPPVLKVEIIGRPNDLPRLAERLCREAPGLEVSSSSPYNLEITARGVSKGDALRQLASRLRIPRPAILAVGDSENDISMLTYAQLGVAMGNGTAAVKAAAGRVTATNDEDGVARVIEEYCLRR